MSKDGAAVGLLVGELVSPSSVGCDVVGALLGWPVGIPVGLLDVGLTVG